ncbi:MAG: aminotransferase class I/II-fold pyridoxal phosphate-dependent enzyme [Clostridiaceae bacterium]|nr:aminotransferase class I/II-fold pyridoxal phosphate-dependent enzyme [Clostridiaceae bacterium]
MSELPNSLSSVVQALPPSAIRKFFDLANEMKGEVISLSIGEPDFVTPWAIREAGIYSLEVGHTHYSPNQGYIQVRQAIADYLKRKFALQYNPNDQIVVTVGGSEALDIAARALINPGDEVIIIEPCFVAYKATVSLAGGIPVVISTRPEDDFKLKPEDLEKAISPKTKYMILGYPCNPTGAVMDRQELSGIVDVLKKYPHVYILSDELYSELSYGPEPSVSISSFAEVHDRCIVVNGFSKSLAMTGWRIGYAAGPKPIIAAMNKIHQYCIMCSPTTSQYAIIEACLNGDKDIAEMQSEYNRRRRVILNGLSKAGLDCFEPMGAFYAFPSIKSTGLTSEEFCERFLMEKKVAIVPGTAFGECGQGHVRISYAASMQNITEAMRRLREFIQELNTIKGVQHE